MQLIPHITALHDVMRSEQKFGLCRVLCPKPMVFRAQDPIIVQVTPDVSAEDMLQHLTCNPSQGNRAVIGWIWAGPLFENGSDQSLLPLGGHLASLYWLAKDCCKSWGNLSRKRLQDPRRNFIQAWCLAGVEGSLKLLHSVWLDEQRWDVRVISPWEMRLRGVKAIPSENGPKLFTKGAGLRRCIWKQLSAFLKSRYTLVVLFLGLYVTDVSNSFCHPADLD